MKKLFVILNLLLATAVQAQKTLPANYDVVWTTQSDNSAASMPCGGGDIGINVWTEDNDILFYLSRSGTFDENNAMLKLGRVRLQLSPNPFANGSFRQQLHLEEGYITITGADATVKIWVDVHRPVVHAAVSSRQNITVKAVYENWRFRDFTPVVREYRANSYKYPRKDIDVVTYKDSICYDGNRVVFFHQNRSDLPNVFDRTVHQQGLDAVKDSLYNPLANRIFGGSMYGKGFVPGDTGSGHYVNTDYHSWSLVSSKPAKAQELTIALSAAGTTALPAWQQGLAQIEADAYKTRKTAAKNTAAWWQQYWQRSYILIDGQEADSMWQVGRNYQLFRYMLGCNAYGKWPTKFNGGLFTFDPVFIDTINKGTPDHRNWGGGTMTAQNQRLVYYPLFRSGDLDMIQPQFDFYLRSQKNAELRSRVYWQHGGACFTEQIENFGLPNIAEYGYKRPENFDKGLEYNAWLEYTWETVLEFCNMMLDTRVYEGRDIHQYLPFIESCLQFFDEHYQQLARQRGIKTWDQNGNYVFFPSSAAETYKMTYNATTYTSALRVVLTKLTALPDGYLSAEQTKHWAEMLQRIPPTPTRTENGYPMLAPAENWQRIQNTETPQLYPVYPWGLYGIGRPDLERARNTYLHDSIAVKHHHHESWAQAAIFAARLGLTDEAVKYTTLKLKNGNLRFPAFWGPGHDWVPDHNWGGSGMIALQEMLMQTVDDKIYLLPAWPKGWNGRFKLHAPQNTTVAATVQDGQIKNLRVTPESRKKDIVIY